jgi:hypothetical protein
MTQERKSNPRNDLTGQTFTYLTPREYLKGSKWVCDCKCGNETIVSTRNLTRGHTQSCGCLQKERAGAANTKDMIDFENEFLRVLHRDGSSDRLTATWECLCKRCGNHFVAEGVHIRREEVTSCGCIKSKEERKIANLLSDNKVEFSQEYTFADLVGINGGKLRFDFAIFQNGKLTHLIEYQGEQHFKRTAGAWARGFETLQAHDELKRAYCRSHSIPLIEIRGSDYSLDDLLNYNL